MLTIYRKKFAILNLIFNNPFVVDKHIRKIDTGVYIAYLKLKNGQKEFYKITLIKKEKPLLLTGDIFRPAISPDDTKCENDTPNNVTPIKKESLRLVEAIAENVEIEPLKDAIDNNKIIGVDVGERNFITLSSGAHYNLTRQAKSILKQLNDINAKTIKSVEEANLVPSLEEELKLNIDNLVVSCCKSKYLKNATVIVMETLCVKNYETIDTYPKLWYCFQLKLTETLEKNNQKIIIAPKIFPSTQLCSNCNMNFKNIAIRSTDVWVCPNCKIEHNRDVNAAKNLVNYGIGVHTV